MGNEVSTAVGAASTVGTSVAAAATLGQVDAINKAVVWSAHYTGKSFMKTNVRHAGELTGVSIAAAATLGRCEAVNRCVRRSARATRKELARSTALTVGVTSSVGLSVLYAPSLIVATGASSVTRLVEIIINGTFTGSVRDGITELCAFASADVYSVRLSGRIQGLFTLATNEGTWSIQCVGGHQSHNLRVALYRVAANQGYTLIVAFRGTDFSRLGDLVHDMKIVLGFLNVSYQSDLGSAESLMRLHNCTRIVVTGHSLGGAIAQVYASENYSTISACHVFNPGTGCVPNDLDTGSLNGLIQAAACRTPHWLCSGQKIFVHHIWGDPLSCLAGCSSTTTVHTYRLKRIAVLAHSISNFTTFEMDRKVEDRSSR